MKDSTKLFFLFSLATVWSAEHAFGSTVVNSALRRVSFNNSQTPEVAKYTTDTFGPFNDSVSVSLGSDDTATNGNADQNTDLQVLSFGGTGSAAIVRHVNSPSFVLSSSSVLVFFTTNTFYDWSTSGMLTADSNGGYAYMTLLNMDTSAYVVNKQTSSGTPSVNLAGGDLLVPGHYQLVMEAQGSGNNGGDVSASAQFTDAFLTLTPTDTPEPSSLGLLTVGAASLLCRARRRRA